MLMFRARACSPLLAAVLYYTIFACGARPPLHVLYCTLPLHLPCPLKKLCCKKIPTQELVAEYFTLLLVLPASLFPMLDTAALHVWYQYQSVLKSMVTIPVTSQIRWRQSFWVAGIWAVGTSLTAAAYVQIC